MLHTTCFPWAKLNALTSTVTLPRTQEMKRRTKMQRRKKTAETKRKKKRNKWCVYDVESRGLKIEIVKDLSTVVFASALWYQNIFFRFGNCALCTISRKYLLTMSSGLKPFLSYWDEFLDKTFLNVTFLKYKSYCAYLQLRLWISTITNYV